MSVAEHEIKVDQRHFDTAWDQRERMRQSFAHLGETAAGPRAAAAEVRTRGKEIAASIAPAEEAVAFGRFDDDDESIYVGRNLIMSQDRDVLVVNWQAPAAAPYYRATVADPIGIRRRRVFTTQRNRITRFEDTVFAELARRVEELTERQKVDINDALLADLERVRTSEMQDIVQTIHHSQYDLVQLPLGLLLIIQGGPGTGKTAVVLHRVSWLLFNEHDLVPEDILVVGPNAAFTQYIKSVLPALGDASVAHIPLTHLGPVRSTGRVEPYETLELKGQARMTGLLARALSNRVRPPSEPIEVDTTAGRRILNPQGIAEGVRRLVPAGGTTFEPSSYSSGRSALRQLIESAVLALPNRPSAVARSVDAALDRIWPALTPARFLQELLASRNSLIQAGGDDFTARDIDRLYRQAASNLGAESWSDADVALLDEADWLINRPLPSYSHIVVDEAQDLSSMQLRSLVHRSTNGSFTLSGDIAQSTGPWARDSWTDVLGALQTNDVNSAVRNLEYGYRVPKEVYAVAQPLLGLIAPELEPPIVVRNAPRAPELRWTETEDVLASALQEAQAYAGKGFFVGMICSDDTIGPLAEAVEEAGVSARLVNSGQLGQSINLMTASESKGLEFDAIVVIEPAAIASDGSHGLRNLYIALTRTTKHLSVVYSKALPEIGLQPGRDELVTLAEPVSLADDAPQSSSSASEPRPGNPLPPRLQKAVDTYAEGLAEEIGISFQPSAYDALLRSLAALLGVQPTADPPWAAPTTDENAAKEATGR